MKDICEVYVDVCIDRQIAATEDLNSCPSGCNGVHLRIPVAIAIDFCANVRPHAKGSSISPIGVEVTSCSQSGRVLLKENKTYRGPPSPRGSPRAHRPLHSCKY